MGSYDAIGKPARTWLLDLCRSHGVEAIFAGHTHFRFFNRVSGTRVYSLPSTTTTRPGFYEAFSVLPSHQGKADLPKLGLTLLRILDDGHVLHLIRTNGAVGPATTDWAEILTCTTAEIPGSPLGAFLRLPLAAQSDGAVGYPYHVRHRVRDDYPLLGCLELGLQHVRFPIDDLRTQLQADRLRVLSDEGVSLTAMVIWDHGTDLGYLVDSVAFIDVLEVQLPGHLVPTPAEAEDLARLAHLDIEVSVSPILMEDVGLAHRRGRSGFRLEELSQLTEALMSNDLTVDRAVCLIEPESSPWDTINASSDLVMNRVAHLDFVLMLGDDDADAVVRVVEAMLASACIANCRLFIDPLQDSDRTASVSRGLLDRLSNPRPAFEVAKTINTVLYGGPIPHNQSYSPSYSYQAGEHCRVISVSNGHLTLWAVIGTKKESAAESIDANHAARSIIDPCLGRSKTLSGHLGDLRDALSAVGCGVALVIGGGSDGTP